MEKFSPILPVLKLISEKLKLNLDNIDNEGRLIISHPYFVRLITYQIQRSLNRNVLPGKLNSLAILNGLFDFIMNKFDDEIKPNSIKTANDFLKSKLSLENYNKFLKEFVENFPSKKFLYNQTSIDKIFENSSDQLFKEIFIRNLIIVFISNQNKAVFDLKFLFDDDVLKQNSIYFKSIEILREYFDNLRVEQLNNKSLIEFLFEPIIHSPENIEGQLHYIKENWKRIIPEDLINQILKAIDLIKEDAKIFQTGFGPGETKVPTFSLEELLGFGDKFKSNFYPITPLEEEKFTPDTDWMPKVILIAKNIYVWLFQLSKKYNREIKKLDQIPDEELNFFATSGFNALWLIGIWERSPASRKIKQLSGNPEALASAYSIYDYVIAQDLGGEEAFQNLNERCWSRGIRLACDIVPNHMGIYSKWIIEHPDYFIQTDYPPFPSYSFTGPDLSDHPDFQIRIEDKYWTRQDAAVVFQLVENKTGRVRYIYHGNDGTNMPWNDTAQLNLLMEEVREALIQLIFSIARKFSIIRLDAAMTLTQKHYQRLWFPVPGTGGAIPSRMDFSMSTDEFLNHYPKEFWREVIDRINREKPDTLLLAEAFWLMEGYFVRTLGMHRVYNSAFMNMLKNEDNAKYRDLIANTLKFNPEILKRYVNFLSNPDEETAINQFGDGDKYFGCCIMMVTMPGLPLFAHGQIDGFREKYGHEYSKAYYDEKPNEYLIERHKREIFPLMKKRYLFSQVENFELFDFKNDSGEIIESVFAYSNRFGNEAALIFYNNSYNTFYGYIDISSPKNYGSSESEADKRLISRSLGEALGIKNSDKHFYIIRETKTNLEYLRKGSEFYSEKFFTELKGYEYKVFLDFRELYDIKNELDEFYNFIGKRGFESLNQELYKYNLSKIANELQKNFCYEKISKIIKEDLKQGENTKDFQKTVRSFSEQLNINRIEFEYEMMKTLKSLQDFKTLIDRLKNRKNNPQWLQEILKGNFDEVLFESDLYKFFVTIFLNYFKKNSQLNQSSKEIFIQEIIKHLFAVNEFQTISSSLPFIQSKIDLLIGNDDFKNFEFNENRIINLIRESLSDSSIQNFVGLNEFENKIYYHKERFEELLRLVLIFFLLSLIKNYRIHEQEQSIKLMEFQKTLRKVSKFQKFLLELSESTRYEFVELKKRLGIYNKY